MSDRPPIEDWRAGAVEWLAGIKQPTELQRVQVEQFVAVADYALDLEREKKALTRGR